MQLLSEIEYHNVPTIIRTTVFKLATMSPVILLVVLFLATLFVYVPAKALYVCAVASGNTYSSRD